MTLPPFSLPSQPTTKITLREAFVEDALDFAGVARSHEEEVTTLFLNRLQDKATFVDSKIWTIQDRRFGLLWYWLHTAKDPEVPHSYICGHCGEKHTYLADYRQIPAGYRPIKGLPERDIFVGDEKLTVRPLNGADAEALEAARLELSAIKAKYGEDSGQFRKREAAIRVERLCRVLGWTSTEDEKRIKNMSVAQFDGLTAQVENALSDLTHGLESAELDGVTHLCLPPHRCPNISDREETTRLWVFFRNLDYVPKI